MFMPTEHPWWVELESNIGSRSLGGLVVVPVRMLFILPPSFSQSGAPARWRPEFSFFCVASQPPISHAYNNHTQFSPAIPYVLVYS